MSVHRHISAARGVFVRRPAADAEAGKLDARAVHRQVDVAVGGGARRETAADVQVVAVGGAAGVGQAEELVTVVESGAGHHQGVAGQRAVAVVLHVGREGGVGRSGRGGGDDARGQVPRAFGGHRAVDGGGHGLNLVRRDGGAGRDVQLQQAHLVVQGEADGAVRCRPVCRAPHVVVGGELAGVALVVAEGDGDGGLVSYGLPVGIVGAEGVGAGVGPVEVGGGAPGGAGVAGVEDVVVARAVHVEAHLVALPEGGSREAEGDAALRAEGGGGEVQTNGTGEVHARFVVIMARSQCQTHAQRHEGAAQ